MTLWISIFRENPGNNSRTDFKFGTVPQLHTYQKSKQLNAKIKNNSPRVCKVWSFDTICVVGRLHSSSLTHSEKWEVGIQISVYKYLRGKNPQESTMARALISAGNY